VSDRAIQQWLKHANSPRRYSAPQTPPDEIDGRAVCLRLHKPTKDDDAEYVAAWPRERCEIVRESHEAVLQSLARYGVLP
jgi:hypothetical protein